MPLNQTGACLLSEICPHPHFQYSLNSLSPLRPHTVHRALSATWLTVVSGRKRFSNSCTTNAQSWTNICFLSAYPWAVIQLLWVSVIH